MRPRMDGLTGPTKQKVLAAAQALDAGRVTEAEKYLAAVPAADAEHPEVLRMAAGIFGMQGLYRNALDAMRRAVAQRPADAVYHNTLGTLLGQAGDYDAAINALRQTCELQPDMSLAWYNLGIMLTRSVRNEEAVTAVKRAVALDSQHMSARALLADLLRMQGRVIEATQEYRRVLNEQPFAGMAWWGLADITSSRFDMDDIRRMREAKQHRLAKDDDLIAIGFALAKAYDDVGNFEKSLASLAEANRMAQRRQRWDRNGFSKAITAVNQIFFPPPQGAGDNLGLEVIFIVGLPRSGSTLVEQILASHSTVEGAGELADLPQVLAEESRRRKQPFPQWVSTTTPQDWRRLGERYLERTAQWRRQKPVFTDKLPGNWIYVGAIRAMLPGAHIIGTCRDALETCFSCYRQRLDNNEYTREFDDLASYWRDADRSLRLWSHQDPDRVLLHHYEALLDSPATCIRQMLAFCDLPFEEACLNFHENKREVRSPSATQVRQPLRRDTGRSSRYGALLDPLRKALELPVWSE